jgi:DNA-directed RNA polymerase specialized sigma24 family protein
MAMPQIVPSPDRATLLADASLRSALVRFVRARVPAAEVEDVVQSTLTDALAAASAPSEPEELRRWVHGIARNKVVDFHRKAGREIPRDPPPGAEPQDEGAPHSARELLSWAERELPDGAEAQSTLEWMLREGDGEKLEHIAEEANLPAPRVRQRVSRLRRHLRARWAAAVAAALALALVGYAIYRMGQPKPDDIAREEVPVPSPEDRAAELRLEGLGLCKDQQWQRCIDALDRAKALDPVGDTAEKVQEARRAAARGLSPEPNEPEPQQIPPDPKEKGQLDAKPVPTSKAAPAPKPSSVEPDKELAPAKPAPKAPTKPKANPKWQGQWNGSSDFPGGK